MEAIEKLTQELDGEITRVHNIYVDLHRELDQHRGKPLSDTNIEEVNRILKGIQDTFAQMHPAFHFIATRHQYVTNVVNDYNNFIDVLKKAGAKQDEPAKS